MDGWAKGFHTGASSTPLLLLFDRAKESIVFATIKPWAARKDEFVRRARFALVASVALHRKDVEETKLIPFIALAHKHAIDPRNFVKGSWALRSAASDARDFGRTCNGQQSGWRSLPTRPVVGLGKNVLRDVK